jgi:hypothetical protein
MRQQRGVRELFSLRQYGFHPDGRATARGSFSFTTKEAQMANTQMANKLEEVQELGKTQLEAATTSSSAFVKNFKTIADEATAYTEKSLAKVSAFLEELRSAKSLESAVHIQSEYTKTFFADFAAYLTKIGEVYSNLSREVLKPIEAVNSSGRAQTDDQNHPSETGKPLDMAEPGTTGLSH